MKKSLSSIPQENTLGSFCHDSSSLRTKIALLTFYKVRNLLWAEKLILVFEYLQLISQATLSTNLDYQNKQNRVYFFEIIIYVLKLINPSHLVLNTDSILVMVFCCTLLKLVLFGKVIYASARNKEMNSWLLCLWRWIYQLQTRILYFLFTSFWIKTMIEAKEGGFRALGMSKVALLIAGVLLILAELLFTLMLETQLCYFLPTKNFLSSKNNHLQMMTLMQKFVIQVITLLVKSDSEALNWIVPIVGIIFDVKRIYEFFLKLSLYHTKALVIQGGLLALVISLNSSSIVNNILKGIDHQGASLNFVIITWILLALLGNKITQEVLKFQIWSLLFSNGQEENAERLLQKVSLIKELQWDEKIPTSDASNYTLSQLVTMYQNLNFQEIFELQLPSAEMTMKRIYFLYYQKLAKRFPKNSLVKLHFAYRSLKNNEPYSKIIKMVNEIQKRKRSPNHLGSSLLLYEIEKSMRNSQSQKLDFSTYIKSKLLMSDLKNLMLGQTDLQIKICNNMLSDSCDIEEIHNSAQRISNLKAAIQRKMDKLSQTLPENYISPFLFFAEYHMVVNQSTDYFIKYYETYTQRRYKVQKFFQEPNLNKENFYQDSNAFLLISTQKAEYGKIIYCSKSLVEMCSGKSRQAYQGSNISILFPHFLKAYSGSLFSHIGDQVHRVYLYNRDDYLIEADYCIKYHPYLAHGLCLSMIVRPVPASKNMEFLLLNKDGHIEGTSKRLSKIAGNSVISIKDFSDQLHLMNTAFNVILKNKELQKENKIDWTSYFRKATRVLQAPGINDSEMSYEKAREIYSAFTSGEGYEIQLSSWTFNAHVRIVNYGDIQLKLVTLNNNGKSIIETKRTIRKGSENLDTEPILTTERRHLIGETLVSEMSQDEIPRRWNKNLLRLDSDADLFEDQRMDTRLRKEEMQTYVNTYVSSESSIKIRQRIKFIDKL